MHTTILSTKPLRMPRELVLMFWFIEAQGCQIRDSILRYTSCRAIGRLEIKFSKACVSIAQSLPWRVSNDIMEALKRGSLFSDLLHENWKHQLEQYRFLSFYEGVGSVTVPPRLFCEPSGLIANI